jgi:ketosteroid isomerase-like protein
LVVTFATDRDIDVLRTYLRGLEDRRIDVLECWAEDGRLEMPYHPDPAARVLEGLEAIRARTEVARELFASIAFHDLVIVATSESGKYVMEYGSEGVSSNGGIYRNAYCTLATLRDSRIVLWREYFNPSARNEALESRSPMSQPLL